jgi:predicted  nucleic acid-binding Zn-ribbon protein
VTEAALAAQPPAPQKKKGGKKWLAPVLIGAALAIVVAVVLVLTLVVFKGGGPKAAANDLYKAMGKSDSSAMIALVDTSELSKQPGLEAKFTEYVKKNLPAGGLKFTDLKFETKVNGNDATVTAVSGKVTYTNGSGKTSTEDITKLGEGSNLVYLVNKDNKWYIDTKTFPDFYAKEYLTEADAALAKLATDITNQLTSVGATLSQGTQGVSTFQELDARFKAMAGGVDTTLTNLRKQAEDTKTKYKSVESLQNVKEYQNYASLRVQSVDVLIETIDKLGKELEELGGYITGLSANPPTTTGAANAAQQGANNIQTRYNAEFTALQQKANDLESQANDLKQSLGL